MYIQITIIYRKQGEIILKVVFVKRRGIDIYDVVIDGVKSKYRVVKDRWNTDIFYLVYYGERLLRRFSDINEVREFLAGKFIETMADNLLNE